MNINGLFQFMNTDVCDSFFCDVTTENMSEMLEQLMQNPEFLALTQVFVDDVAILRQKVLTKLGQLCKKKKIVPVPLPVEDPKLVDGMELTRIQYAIDDNDNNEAYLRENTVEESNTIVKSEVSVEGFEEPINESLGKHIGEGIYLQQEGYVFKMTTPQFVVYY